MPIMSGLTRIAADTAASINNSGGVVPAVRNSVSNTVDALSEKLDAVTDRLTGVGRNALAQVIDIGGKVFNKIAPASIAAMATIQYRGTQGSFCSVTQPLRLVARFTDVTNDRHHRIGWPVMDYHLLTSLTGFVLCENAIVEIPGTITEEQAVEEFLNSGFYIE